VKALALTEVVNETAGACDQARVLAPADGVTQNRAGHQRLHGKSRVTCHGRCDNTNAAPAQRPRAGTAVSLSSSTEASKSAPSRHVDSRFV